MTLILKTFLWVLIKMLSIDNDNIIMTKMLKNYFVDTHIIIIHYNIKKN